MLENPCKAYAESSISVTLWEISVAKPSLRDISFHKKSLKTYAGARGKALYTHLNETLWENFHLSGYTKLQAFENPGGA